MVKTNLANYFFTMAEKVLKTPETLSVAGNADIEQHTNVTLATIHAKDGSVHVYLIHGVYFQEMTPIEEKAFLELKVPFHTPDQDYAFCLYSLDEFIAEVCEKGGHYLYWPRTKRYYQVPTWYQDKLPKSLANLRSHQSK